MLGVIFVALIVCSLVGAGLGTAFFDDLGRDDDPSDLEEESRRAERELRDRVEANPDDPAAMVALANYLANVGQLTEAITWYERALAIDPEDWESRLDFAQALAEGGKRTDAELQFRRVIEAQPANERAHFYLAELYRGWEPPRTDDAVREYQAAITAAPDSFIADQAREQLAALGAAAATPSGSPLASPGATPGT